MSRTDSGTDNDIFELSLLAHSLYDVLQGPVAPFKVVCQPEQCMVVLT